MQEVKTFKQSELVLKVNRVYDTNALDLRAWKPFMDRLCGDRTYQKEAIENAIIFLASGQYQTLADLAAYNYAINSVSAGQVFLPGRFYECLANAEQTVRQH